MQGYKTNKIDSVCTIIILPETILQNQEKAARSARKARLNIEPVQANVIRVRSQNGILSYVNMRHKFPFYVNFTTKLISVHKCSLSPGNELPLEIVFEVSHFVT